MTAEAVLEARRQTASARFELRLLALELDRCVICGVEGDGPECSSCTAGWDKVVDRAGDL
jgi:hypothetical protein